MLPLRLRSLLRRGKVEQELDEELAYHLEQATAYHVARGLSPEQARVEARRSLGAVARHKEECRDTRGVAWFEDGVRDLRYGLRVLEKSPGFAFTAIATLALAITANAIVFAALNAVFLRPLPVARPASLYSIHQAVTNAGGQSYLGYQDLQRRNSSFEDLAGYTFQQLALDDGAKLTRDWAVAATGNYFDVLGVPAHIGRVFHSFDERGPDSAPYVVLTYDFWVSRFQADRSVVGRKVQLNKNPYTILGVTPPGFRGTLLFATPAYFVPMINQRQLDGRNLLDQRGESYVFLTFGHLKPGVSPERAASELSAISAELARLYPNDHRAVTYQLGRPSLYGEHMGGPVKAFLTALMLLAALILLAACANLGSLFAARAADRARELALRLALGAARFRLVRQLLVEALLISLAGGLVGLTLSQFFLQWLVTVKPFPQFPLYIPVEPDPNVYLAALGLALASGLLFGLAPLRQVLDTSPYDIVKSGARLSSPRRFELRDLLVVAQVAICAILITSSAVAVRGLVRSLDGPYGFLPQRALLVEAILPMAGYRGDAALPMQKKILDAAREVPGVAGVGLIDDPPLTKGSHNYTPVFADDAADFRPAQARFRAVSFATTPGYRDAAGTALLTGRDFADSDDRNAPRVALVNREFLRRAFPSNPDPARATGASFRLEGGVRVQIVGVVEDGKYETLNEPQRPALFLPLWQVNKPDAMLVLQAAAGVDPQVLAPAIRQKLRQLDAGLPLFLQTWQEALSLPLFPSRIAAIALGVLGALGAVLSLTGVFGLAAYSVSRRMKELGIRLALGARRGEILSAALGRAFRLLGYGSVAGLLLGLATTRVLSAIVYQASPWDPLVLASAVLLLLVLGLAATWIPAQRALSAEPLKLLRED